MATSLVPARPVPQPRGHHGVQDEDTRSAVPGNVDESGQPGAVPLTHPAQAVPLHLGQPVVRAGRLAEALPVQRADLGVTERAAPVAPKTVSLYATWAYSRIRPPSRSRHRTRIPVTSAGGCVRPDEAGLLMNDQGRYGGIF
jgi:hypothetical protein